MSTSDHGNGHSNSTLRCPDCQATLSGGPACTACGLSLTGPVAGRLWVVDQRLEALDGERTLLLSERGPLLAALRSGDSPTLWQTPASVTVGPTPTVLPARVTTPRKETTPAQVQNTLLTLGALLLALAGVVFAAVTYRHLGVVGRALVLLTLTGAAAAAPVVLLRRGLTASAEALAGVALTLGTLDAWALQRAGLAGSLDDRTYAAVATAVLAVGAGLHASAVRVRVSQLGAAVFAQLPVVLVLARTEASLPVIAVTLAGLGALDVAVASHQRTPSLLRSTTSALAGLAVLGSLGASVLAVHDHQAAAGAGLLALAAIAALAAARTKDIPAFGVLAALVAPLTAAAAWATVRPHLPENQLPLVVLAAALVAVMASALLPRPRREGPVLGALLVAVAGLLLVAEPIALAAGPLTWLAHPWTLTADTARQAVSVHNAWSGGLVSLVVAVAAAGCAVGAGRVLDRVQQSFAAAGALLILAGLLVPLSLDTSYPVALAVLLATAAALGLAAALAKDTVRVALAGASTTLAVYAAVWSVADRSASLTVLPVAAILVALLAVRLLGALTAVAGLLTGAALAAYGADRDLAVDQVGALLLAVPAVCVGLTFVLRRAQRIGLEATAGILAGTAVLLAAGDPGWLSWSLALSGLLALAMAIRPDRCAVGLLGGLLLSASSWVRLADAQVVSPEPYVAPLALVALGFGHLRRRTQPELGSFAAYGPGLSLALVPSLLKALTDGTPTRGLLLLVVALAVVMVGARDRLRAPLILGGLVVVLDGLHLLAPYASALPRWTLLAGAGALLVGVGATYEQRLRDMTRLRERYDTWS